MYLKPIQWWYDDREHDDSPSEFGVPCFSDKPMFATLATKYQYMPWARQRIHRMSIYEHIHIYIIHIYIIHIYILYIYIYYTYIYIIQDHTGRYHLLIVCLNEQVCSVLRDCIESRDWGINDDPGDSSSPHLEQRYWSMPRFLSSMIFQYFRMLTSIDENPHLNRSSPMGISDQSLVFSEDQSPMGINAPSLLPSGNLT